MMPEKRTLLQVRLEDGGKRREEPGCVRGASWYNPLRLCLHHAASKDSSSLSSHFGTCSLASAQTQPANKEAVGPARARMVPYKDVVWRAPQRRSDDARIKSANSFFALFRVNKGAALATADSVYVINRNDRLPGPISVWRLGDSPLNRSVARRMSRLRALITKDS